MAAWCFLAWLLLPGITAQLKWDSFLFFDGVDSIEWTEEEYCITEDMPFDGSISQGRVIAVVSGRRASKEPAKRFFERLTTTQMIMTCCENRQAKIPERLEFVVFGTLNLTVSGKEYEIKHMQLGQCTPLPRQSFWLLGAPSCQFQAGRSDQDQGALHCSGLDLRVTSPRLNHVNVSVLAPQVDVGLMQTDSSTSPGPKPELSAGSGLLDESSAAWPDEANMVDDTAEDAAGASAEPKVSVEELRTSIDALKKLPLVNDAANALLASYEAELERRLAEEKEAHKPKPELSAGSGVLDESLAACAIKLSNLPSALMSMLVCAAIASTAWIGRRHWGRRCPSEITLLADDAVS